MGCDSRAKLFIAVCCLFVVEKGLLAPQQCTVTCTEGQFCSVTVCQPCPYGTFQTEPIHLYLSCKDWTSKETEPHYILSKPGTSVSDAVWVCEDGYVEKPYTVGGYECVPIVTTTPTVSISTEFSATSTTSTTEPTSALLQVQQPSDDLSIGAKASIAVSIAVPCVVFVIAFIVGIVYWKCIKDRRYILHHTKRDTPVTVSVVLDSPIDSGPWTQNPYNTYYRFCFKFVENLGIVTFNRFLNVLYDPSGKFHAENVLQLESSKTKEVNTYLVKSFLRWVELNNGIYRSWIVLALDDVGRAYELVEIEKLVQVNYIDAANNDYEESVSLLSNNRERIEEDDDMKYVRASGAGHETSSSEGRKVLRQDRFRLFYFLTNKIEHTILTRLIHQLRGSSDKFNASNFYNGKLHEERDVSHAFALTIEEWWLQNPGLSLKDIITEFLTDEDIKAVLENSKFQELLQRIVPADTCSTGNRDQEQLHSSHNLVLDAMDIHQASHNTDIGHTSIDWGGDHVSVNNETGHLSNNTEAGHVSNDSEAGHVSNDSEAGHVSNNTEAGHVSNNTEAGHVSNDSEAGHVSNNSEAGHVSNDSEAGHVSNNTEAGHVSNNTEAGHVSNDTEAGHVSNNTETGHVSNNCEEGHVSNDTETGHMSNNTEAGHVSNDTEAGHVSNNTEAGHVSNNCEGGHVSNDTETGHMSNNTETGHVSNNCEGGHVGNDSERGHVGNDSEGHVTTSSDGRDVSYHTQKDQVSSKIKRTKVLV